jgi:hypothetical protein
MTESEWFACTHPDPMLSKGTLEERKRYFQAVFSPYRTKDEPIFERLVSVATEIGRSHRKDEEANRRYAEIVRCLIPFRRSELPRTETVLALARGIVADSAYDRMPILADALEELGADPLAVQHCRYGQHWAGCWVLVVLRERDGFPLDTSRPGPGIGLLPPDVDPIPYLHRHRNGDNQLLLAEQELRRAREAFFAVRADANFLRSVLANGDGGEPLPTKAVQAVLVEAHLLAMDCPIRHYEPVWPSPTDGAFLDRIGFTPGLPMDAAWPRDRFLAALDYYAGATEWPAEEFRTELLRTLDSRTDGFARGVKRREAERLAATALIPPDAEADRIIKYEKHLHAQLTSTMHELERLQARRGGASMPPPQVADLHVTINGQ